MRSIHVLQVLTALPFLFIGCAVGFIWGCLQAGYLWGQETCAELADHTFSDD